VKCQLKTRDYHLEEKFDHGSAATLSRPDFPGPRMSRHLASLKLKKKLFPKESIICKIIKLQRTIIWGERMTVNT
jgi:lambda repressor-like predicted transcriptional regulator